MSEQEIKELKQAEQNKVNTTPQPMADRLEGKGGKGKKKGTPKDKEANHDSEPNFVGPFIIIGIGVYFLLRNMELVTESLHWRVLFHWWPLFFIFIGLNIMTKQLPGVWRTLGSGLVGFTAVSVLGSLLIFGNQAPVLGNYSPPPPPIHRDDLDIPRQQGRDSDSIAIRFNSSPATVQALDGADLDNAGALVKGVVYTPAGIRAERNSRGDKLTIAPQRSNWPMTYTAAQAWQLGLTTAVPLDLELDLGSGTARLDLVDLQLTNLEIDGGSGATTLTLPDTGDYDMSYDIGSGTVWLTMPSQGRHRFEIEGGSGDVHIILRAQIEAWLTVDKGSGNLTVSGQFREEEHGRVYTTPNFQPDSPHQIDLILNMGSGSVSISHEAETQE